MDYCYYYKLTKIVHRRDIVLRLALEKKGLYKDVINIVFTFLINKKNRYHNIDYPNYNIFYTDENDYNIKIAIKYEISYKNKKIKNIIDKIDNNFNSELITYFLDEYCDKSLINNRDGSFTGEI